MVGLLRHLLFIKASSAVPKFSRDMERRFIANLVFPLQSFMDLHFPNGQITYVSGEGLSTIAFLPFCGGLLQVQGQYPGEMKFSFSCKVNQQGCKVS